MFERIVLLASLLLAQAIAFAGEGREAFERFTQNLQTLDARFEQNVLDTENSREGVFYGTFRMKRPDRFRWDYLSPEKRQIIADGRDLWIVEDDLNHVTQVYQPTALKGSPATVLLGEGSIDDEFKVVELGERQGLQWLELLPLDEESDILRILLAFKGNDLTRLELTDQFGQISRFSFFQIQRNLEMPDSDFDYQPPDGWDIFQDYRG